MKFLICLNGLKNRDDNSMTEVIEVINEGIKIDLPESETTRTTIRINKLYGKILIYSVMKTKSLISRILWLRH